MNDAWLTTRGLLALGLVFFLGGLNAAPAAPPPVPAPPASAETTVPLTGKIAHVTILGNKNISTDLIRASLTSRVGASYTPQTTDKDSAALNGMGVFQTTSVTATAVSGGVDLTYTVSEYPLVKSIRFTADTPTKEPTVPAGTLLARMKTRTGQVLNTKVLVSDLKALFDHDTGYVRNQGYLFDVSKDINIDPPTGILTIPLVEGYVHSIQVSGNARVKTADILARMHTKPGDLYDENAVAKDLGAIYEMGEFNTVGPDIRTETAPGQIAVTIPVVEREAATLDKLDETQGKIIPFLYDPVTTPYPVVQVSVNGKPPLPFMVDTGATAALLLDPWAAARLGLRKQDLTGKANGYNYATAPIQGVVLQGMSQANNAEFDPKQAQVVDLSILSDPFMDRRVAGIVGLGMLSQSTTRFDFAAKTLTLFSYPHPPLRLPGATVLPLRSTPDRLFTVHVTLAPGTAADLTLDTGSNATTIPLAVMGTLHPTATTYGSFTEQIDGLYSSPDLRLPGLTLGTLQVPDAVVGTIPPGGRMPLGLNILAGYRMTLDGPNGQLSLEPSAAGGRYVRGWSGLDLTRTGTGWTVKELEGISPARQAGMRVGDEVLAVNGREIQGLTLRQADMLIAGLSGRPLRVTLRRGKAMGRKPLDVSWTPLDKFSAPRDAVYGLTMRKPSLGPWVIVSVLPGCPGDRAGLQAGDEITRMDGAPVADMPLDQLIKIMGQASESITLAVTRAGRAEPLSVKLAAPPQIAP